MMCVHVVSVSKYSLTKHTSGDSASAALAQKPYAMKSSTLPFLQCTPRDTSQMPKPEIAQAAASSANSVSLLSTPGTDHRSLIMVVRAA